ncbi:MAG: hypothetical protein WCZ25_12050, partial [Aminobacteriaceae bacterium]
TRRETMSRSMIWPPMGIWAGYFPAALLYALLVLWAIVPDFGRGEQKGAEAEGPFRCTGRGPARFAE